MLLSKGFSMVITESGDKTISFQILLALLNPQPPPLQEGVTLWLM